MKNAANTATARRRAMTDGTAGAGGLVSIGWSGQLPSVEQGGKMAAPEGPLP